jgi:adenylate cyclase
MVFHHRRRGARIKLIGLGISVTLTLFFLFVDVVDPEFVKNTLDLLEMKSLDFRFRLRETLQSEKPASDLAVIAIDEKSIKEVGRWPWSRAEMANLVKRVAAGEPRIIGFDILFSEPEVSESLKLIRELKKDISARSSPDPKLIANLALRERQADADAQFAEAIQKAGNVVLPFAMQVPTERQSVHPQPLSEPPAFLISSSFGLVKQVSTAKTFIPIEADGVIPPIPMLAERAKGLGHVYYEPDRDGVLRWEYLVMGYRDDYYPSFSLQIARESLGIRREEMKLWLGEAVELGGIRIPTDERGRMLINYSGREGAFPTFSATDVLHGRVSPGLFQDKILLIGTTALGTYDLKVTPLSANMPGVEKNATVIENILNRHFLLRTDAMRLLDAFFILLFGASLWLVLPRLSALQGVAVAGSMLIGYMFLAQYLFQQKGLWINLLYPTATLAFSYTSLTVLRFMTEERQAQEVRRMFSSYVSPKMVAELVKDPDKARLGGERKELSVLFSDVRGFTTFSEQHQPEEVVAILNEYMNAMTEVIFYWEGTLDKFVGDAIMVFWGAPLDQPHHAELSIRCALHMQKRLGELQEKWRAEGKEILDAGIGINSGEMVVGNMGAEGKKMDYTVIGDNVNLAARVESLTRQYNAKILITESTYQGAKELIEVKELFPNEKRKRSAKIRHEERRKKRMKIGHALFKDLDAVKVKGKVKPVRVFEVIGIQEE